nr:DUF4382 domain-containing protein [Nanoarchaeota archaeon]
MKQKIMLLGLLILLVSMTGVLAQEPELISAEPELEVEAGTLPGNLFYGLDKAIEKIRLAFTFGNVKKAKLHMRFAEERLAELKVMVGKGKPEYIDDLVQEHDEELQEAQEEIDKAAAKGKSVEEVATHVAEMTYKHILVLERVLGKVPEQAKEHIQHAINASIRGNIQAVESIEKETGKPADVPKVKPEVKPSGKPEAKPEKEGKGKLVMQITDKAGIDITKLEVTISSVKVHASGEAVPGGEECVEEEYNETVCINETITTDENCTNITEEQEVCINETIVIDENCTNVTEEQEICINETFYNETCTDDDCVNGTFVEESICVNGTLINESCVNGTFVNEINCVNGTFVPAGCINESYIEEVCHNETVVINETCINETETQEVCDNETVVINQTCINETETQEVCENVTGTETVCTDINGGGDAGWRTVVDEEQTFDLIAIQDVKAFSGETDLEPGKYTQIRLLIASVSLEVSGEPASLKIPSNKIKLVKPFTINSGETTTLTLDFDAGKSVHQAGSKYILKPTIKVIQE